MSDVLSHITKHILIFNYNSSQRLSLFFSILSVFFTKPISLKKTSPSSLPDVWQIAVWLCRQRSSVQKASKTIPHIATASLLQAFPTLQTIPSVQCSRYLKRLSHQQHLFDFNPQEARLQIRPEVVLATLQRVPINDKLSRHSDKNKHVSSESSVWCIEGRKNTSGVTLIPLHIDKNIPLLIEDHVLGIVRQKTPRKHLSKRQQKSQNPDNMSCYFEPLYWVKRSKTPSIAFLQAERSHPKKSGKIYSKPCVELFMEQYHWRLPLINTENIPSDLYAATGSSYPIISVNILPEQGIIEPCSARFVACVDRSDHESVMVTAQHRLPMDFSNAALSECKTIDEKDIHLESREDLRTLPLITIDGEDAKDFDDAVFARKSTKTTWELIVAIADVSTFVFPNSALDQEAYERAVSVYLPRRVIPMLPPKLSEHLCSLRPDVSRAVLCVAMIINRVGKIERYRFFKGLMKSNARLTYPEAEGLLLADDRSKTTKINPQITTKVRKNVQNLYDVYRALKHQRQECGTLELETQEQKFRFENNKVVGIYTTPRGQSHQLIEECMIAANICAAHFLTTFHQPLLYRNHEAPLLEKINILQETMKAHSIHWQPDNPISAHSLTQLLKRVNIHSQSEFLQLSVLRSLKQASYGPSNIGHFGLGLTHYTHFTSPIRRYPDLLVHRAIGTVLEHNQAQSSDWQIILPDLPTHFRIKKKTQSVWQEYGEHCTVYEKRADQASRDASGILRCELAQTMIGQSVEGSITSITSFGLFVQLPIAMVEGLLHISTLSKALNTSIYVDTENQCLITDHPQKVFRVGDTLRVWIESVQPLLRKINLSLRKVKKNIKK